MITFKQYLLEASNLSDKDKKTINYLISTICNVYDRSDITTWLKTNVYKFIVNKSNHTNSNFFTKEDFINVKGEKDIRDVFVDVNGALKYRINNITDYLNKTYTEEQASIKYGNNLIRLSFIDAEKEYKEESQKIIEEEGIDYKIIKKYKDGFKMISLLTQKSLNKEGHCMGHCTKDEKYEYLTRIKNKELIVLSLRDNKNRPHATLEYDITSNSIEQIKGNGNGPVIPKYRMYIIEYLNDNRFNYLNDLQNINAILIDRKLFDMDHIPHDLIIKTNVDLTGLTLTKLPQFPEIIYAHFDCSDNKLTSLKGAPQKIQHGLFYCRSNRLETLEHGPIHVDGDFDCSDNKLTSLKGAPVYVGRDFDCSDNEKLTSLEGIPTHIGGDFVCYNVGKQFTKEEIRKLSVIKGTINV